MLRQVDKCVVGGWGSLPRTLGHQPKCDSQRFSVRIPRFFIGYCSPPQAFPERSFPGLASSRTSANAS